MTFDQLVERFGAKKSGSGYIALCPAHEDRRPSLSLNPGKDGVSTLLHCHAGCKVEDVIAAKSLKMADLYEAPARQWDRGGIRDRIVRVYVYRDEQGNPQYEAVRLMDPKDFRARRDATQKKWSIKGCRLVAYKLNELRLKGESTVYIAEGEKDTDRLWEQGLAATTNIGGAGKWRRDYSRQLLEAGCKQVVILPDNDAAGRSHAEAVARSCFEVGISVKIVPLPGIPEKGDVSDFLDAHALEDLLRVVGEAPSWQQRAVADSDTRETDGEAAATIALEDFYGYMPGHTYMFAPSREMWPAQSVNSRLGQIKVPGANPISASTWIDRNRPVEQVTWAPGEPLVISGRLIADGGWFDRPGMNVFNLYRPPSVELGDAANVTAWLDHVYRLYPEEADHIVLWLAHRVQRPQEKINHALVFGGGQGIGKDTILEPLKSAVGRWNFAEVAPAAILGRFNGHVKSVILRISEARDLGSLDRYAFYNHTKSLIAAPPDVLRVDEKHLREYYVFNVCGVILTTNHLTDGIYLPPDDRRHFVAWSPLTQADFPEGYFRGIYRWLAEGGDRHVAAYLAQVDISGFDPKEPPPRTATWEQIVAANQAPEDGALGSALDLLGHPAVVTIAALARVAAEAGDVELSGWLNDRKNGRQVPHRLSSLGYVSVRNAGAQDGLWVINGRRQVIYARRGLTSREQIQAALQLASRRC